VSAAPTPIALGLRALKGGCVAVGVAVDDSGPRIVLSTFLATASDGDRLSLEPYRVAFEMPRGAQGALAPGAGAAVADGRERQRRLAAQRLDEVVRQLREAGCEPVVTALLANRAGWSTELLEHNLSAPEHVAVAEGLAVRDAFRQALGRAGVEVADVDEKTLPALASLCLDPPADARLKALGATVGRPWRKEQKLACLAAWVTLIRAVGATAAKP